MQRFIRNSLLTTAVGTLAITIGVASFSLHHHAPAPAKSATLAKAVAECPEESLKDAKILGSPVYKKYFEMFMNRDRTMKVPLDPRNPNGAYKMVPMARVMACFDEGTPPELQAAFIQAMISSGAWPRPNNSGQQPDYYVGSRWSGTAGQPRNLTWSFVPDGLLLGSGAGEANAGSSLFSSMDSKFGGTANRATWIHLFEAIFARWSQLSGVTYTRVTYNGNDWDDGAAFPGSAGAAGLRGDLRIGSHNIDGSSGILAYNYFPSTGDMVIDSSDSWGTSTNNYRFLRNTLGHEHGHGLGVQHVCPVSTTKLMEPYLATNFDGPQHDDSRAVQWLYGDVAEPNGSAAAAFDLGTLAATSTTTFGNSPADANFPTSINPANTTTLSIGLVGAAADTDYYKFAVPGPATCAFTVTPVGLTYDSSTQNSSTGACNSGTNINSLAIGTLVGTVYSTDGTTVLGTATASAAGNAVVVNATLPAAGTYYLKVNCTATLTAAQSYKFTVGLTAASVNNAPTLGALPNPTINEMAAYSFTATATDPDAGQTITYTLSGAPSGAGINASTGLFTWTPTEAQGPGSYTFSVIATDNGSPVKSDTKSMTIQVNEVNVAPTITNGGNATINELSPYSFTFAATDTDLPANTLTWTLVGAPSGAGINASTGLFTWTPTEAQGPGSYTFDVKVTDNGSPNLSATKTITLTVNEVNTPPVWTTGTTWTVPENATTSQTLIATDADLPAQTLTYSLVSGGLGATVSPSGLLTVTTNESNGGNTYPIVVRVTDSLGAAVDRTINVSVTEDNQAPSLDPISDVTVNDGQVATFTAHGTDPDLPAQALTYSLIGAPGSASINPSTGAFTWTPSNSDFENNYTFTVRVSDPGGLTADRTVTIHTRISSKTFSGTITLQSLSVSPAGHTVELQIRPVGSLVPTQTLTVTLDGSGHYSATVTGLLVGNYDVAFKGTHWLRHNNGNVAVSTSGLSLDDSLMNGDANGDNVVDSTDYFILSDAYDTSVGDPSFDPLADLNEDGTVDAADYFILSDAYDFIGDN